MTSRNASPQGETDTGTGPVFRGLAAVAVVIVLGFHLWPSAFAGGVAGFDVLFVLAGALMTVGLLDGGRWVEGPPVAEFYARLVQRVLPAATLAVVASALLIPLSPEAAWRDLARSALASVLQMRNWLSVGAATADGDPLQHLWALSLVVQCALVWPLVALFADRLARSGSTDPRPLFGGLLLVLGCVSVAFALHATHDGAATAAFFATPARAWELALGGAATLLRSRRKGLGPVVPALGYAGLAAIVVACLGHGATAQVSWLAALGAAAVVLAVGSGSRFGVERLFGIAPLQALGEVAYPLYLWQGVMAVASVALFGAEASLARGVFVVAVSLILAFLTRRFVELRLGTSPNQASANPGRAVLVGATCLFLGAGSASWVRMDRLTHLVPPGVAKAARKHHHFHHGGKHAAVPAAKAGSGTESFQPSFAQASKDEPDAYHTHCIAPMRDSKVRECRYDSGTRGARNIVVVGDSHADQWLPPLRVIARQRGWNLVAITKSGCVFAILDPSRYEDTRRRSCAKWNRDALKRVSALHPEWLVVAQSVHSAEALEGAGTVGRERVVAAMLDAWKRVADDGANIAVIRDTPRPGRDVPDCLAAPGATEAACSTARTAALAGPDPLMLAAARFAAAHLVDMSDTICDAQVCRAIVGHTVVWRDAHHLTATFARSLAPTLARRLDGDAAIAAAPAPAPASVATAQPFQLALGPSFTMLKSHVARARSGLLFERQVFVLRGEDEVSAGRQLRARMKALGFSFLKSGRSRHREVDYYTRPGAPRVSLEVEGVRAAAAGFPAGTTVAVHVGWKLRTG